MLVLLKRTSFVTTFYGLYFKSTGTFYRLHFLWASEGSFQVLLPLLVLWLVVAESWYCQWPTKHMVQSFSNGPSWRREPISSVKGYNFILGMKQRYQTTQYHSEKKFSINGMIQTPRASSWSGRSTNGSSSFDMLNHITIY